MRKTTLIHSRKDRRIIHGISIQRIFWPGCLILVLGILLAITSPARAQEVTGSILGSVTDSSGAILPNAAVTLTNTDRNAVERTLATNGAGQFTAPLLPIGKYSMKVEAAGFKTFQKSGITLNVNDKLDQIVVLQVGNVTQTVSVAANALHVDTQSATASSLISGTQIRQLSLESRNYAGFLSLLPGVVSNMSGDLLIGSIDASGSSNDTAVSLNGSFGTQNNWTIDGADNVDRGVNGQNLDYPSLDAIAQVSVLRGNYNAEYGRSAGGQINVITRSGTNQFHGGLYEFFRNNVLDANTWGNKHFSQPAVPRTPLRYNDFGGTLGGPIFIPRVYNVEKNRTFFFYSQEVRRIVESFPTVSLVPNLAERGSQPMFPYPICLAPVNGDGTCPAGQSSMTIPSNMVSPAAAAYLKDVYSHVPLPQITNSDQLAANQNNIFNANQIIVRVDHRFNQVVSGFARIVRDSIPSVQGGGLFNANAIPNVTQTTTKNPGENVAASLNFIFSPTLLNQVEYAWSYDAINSASSAQFAASNSPDVVSAIQLPYVNQLNSLPSISFGAYLGDMFGFGTYRDSNKNNMIFDNLTKISGRHTLQFGVTYSHYEKSETSQGNTSANNAGGFDFTATPDTTLSNGQDPSAEWHQEFAYFLLGRSTQFSQLSQNLHAFIFQNQLEFYGQDQFRVRPNLTLNYGIRYSMYRQPTDGRNHATSFDPTRFNPANAPVIDNSGNICTPATQPCDGTSNTNPNYDPLNGVIIAGNTSPYGNTVVRQANLNIQPRIGFSWDPTAQGKMSVRGGYGIFYDATSVNNVEVSVFQNVPFSQSTLINNTSLDNPAGGQVSNNSVTFLTGSDPHWNQPSNQQWNLDIQRELPSNIIFDIGYYGSKGTHLLGPVDINEPIPGAYAGSPLIQNNPNFIAEGNPQIDGNTEGLLNLIRPYQGYGSIDVYKTVFKSNYESLQVSVQKQFTADSLIQANYTWSKMLTNLGSLAPQNSYNLDADYGPSVYDDRNVFNLNFVYDLPFYKSQRGLTGHLLGGWESSGIVGASSGEYLSAGTSSSNDPGGLGVFVSTTQSKEVRPDQVSNPNQHAPHTVAEWYNVNAFQDVPSDQFRPGDAPRSSIQGPGSWTIALTAMKNIKVTEGSQFQFRVEAYNVLNHTNYNAPDTTLGDGTTGQVLGAGDPRILQLGLKYNF